MGVNIYTAGSYVTFPHTLWQSKLAMENGHVQLSKLLQIGTTIWHGSARSPEVIPHVQPVDPRHEMDTYIIDLSDPCTQVWWF